MRAVSGLSHLLSKPTLALSGAPTSHRRAPISLSAIALVTSLHGLITPAFAKDGPKAHARSRDYRKTRGLILRPSVSCPGMMPDPRRKSGT